MTRWLIPLLLIAFPLQAAVFKWQSEDGTVHYSDTPQPGAEELQLQESKPTSSPEQAEGEYLLFEIESPANEQTFRSAEGQVSVNLSLNPSLQEGHKIRFIVDGKTMEEELQLTQILLQNVTLGSHTLQAQVVDSDGNAIKSTAIVRFHLRQLATSPI